MKIEEKEFDPYEITGKGDKNAYKARKVKVSTETEKKIEQNIKSSKTTRSKIKKQRSDSGEPKDTLGLVLSIIFIILLIFTLILGVKVIKARKNYKEHLKANIVVPVLGTGVNNEISVDISNMKKDETREYVFKVTNTKNKNINKEEVSYNLVFGNLENIDVQVYKNNEKENLLTSDKIEGLSLKKDETQTDTYKVEIKAKKKIKDKELLKIAIAS